MMVEGTIDLTDGDAIAYGKDEDLRVSVSEDLVKTVKGVPSELVVNLVYLPNLPPCQKYADEVTPPKPTIGICKAIGSNNLVLSWHIGSSVSDRPKFYEIWHFIEPFEEWKKVGTVAALTPPMSCALSKVPYGISHYTIRAIDVEGRRGPFATAASCYRRSEIQSRDN